MESLALLLVAPILWPFIAKAVWKHEIVAWEIAANVAIGVVVVVAGWAGGRYMQMADTEVVNGEVLRKEKVEVSCSHSYKCNCSETCSTDSQGRRSCTETCSTCYEHSNDWDWTLFTNVGDIDIDRIDRQGSKEPPRFTKAKPGDPVAQTQTFTNYVKAAPNSLFNTIADQAAFKQYENMVPAYPTGIYDYHYINRVLLVGAKVPDAAVYNDKLAHALKKLGPNKQANAILVFTSVKDPNYANALRAHWLGAKKNDIVVVVGTPDYPKVEWASVVSWTDNQLFKVQLADAIRDLETLTPDTVVGLLTEHTTKQFQRKRMRDFEYLKWDIEPPMWLLATLFAVSLLASIIASVLFSRNSERVGGFHTAFRGRTVRWRT